MPPRLRQPTCHQHRSRWVGVFLRLRCLSLPATTREGWTYPADGLSELPGSSGASGDPNAERGQLVPKHQIDTPAISKLRFTLPAASSLLRAASRVSLSARRHRPRLSPRWPGSFCMRCSDGRSVVAAPRHGPRRNPDPRPALNPRSSSASLDAHRLPPGHEQPSTPALPPGVGVTLVRRVVLGGATGVSFASGLLYPPLPCTARP